MKNNKIVKGNLRKTESHYPLITPLFQQKIAYEARFQQKWPTNKVSEILEFFQNLCSVEGKQAIITHVLRSIIVEDCCCCLAIYMRPQIQLPSPLPKPKAQNPQPPAKILCLSVLLDSLPRIWKGFEIKIS